MHETATARPTTVRPTGSRIALVVAWGVACGRGSAASGEVYYQTHGTNPMRCDTDGDGAGIGTNGWPEPIRFGPTQYWGWASSDQRDGSLDRGSHSTGSPVYIAASRLLVGGGLGGRAGETAFQGDGSVRRISVETAGTGRFYRVRLGRWSGRGLAPTQRRDLGRWHVVCRGTGGIGAFAASEGAPVWAGRLTVRRSAWRWRGALVCEHGRGLLYAWAAPGGRTDAATVQ